MTSVSVVRIIIEFFRANPDILLYMCDNANNQQAQRNRLFLRWFMGFVPINRNNPPIMLMPPLSYIHASEAARTTADGRVLTIGLFNAE